MLGHPNRIEECHLLGRLHRFALVITDVSGERIASIIKMVRIGELGTLAMTSNRRNLRRNSA
jgi:hypothetical protein